MLQDSENKKARRIEMQTQLRLQGKVGEVAWSAEARARAAEHIMSTREGCRSLDSTTTTKMLRGRRNKFMTCDV